MFSVVLDSVIDDKRLKIIRSNEEDLIFEIEGRRFVDSIPVDREEVIRALIALGEREVE